MGLTHTGTRQGCEPCESEFESRSPNHYYRNIIMKEDFTNTEPDSVSDTPIDEYSEYVDSLEKLLGKLDAEYCSDEEIKLWQHCHSKHYH